MSPSRILFYFCLSFIFGIFLSSIFKIPQQFLLGNLILAIFLILISWKYEKLMFFGFCILFLVLGIWRHQATLLEIENSKIKKFVGQEIVLTGLIDKEPQIKGKVQQLTISNKQLTIGGEDINVSDKVLVTTTKYPEYKYGDEIKITGKLEKPAIIKGFNYKDYLAEDGIFAIVSFPKIELVGSGQGSHLMSAFFFF